MCTDTFKIGRTTFSLNFLEIVMLSAISKSSENGSAVHHGHDPGTNLSVRLVRRRETPQRTNLAVAALLVDVPRLLPQLQRVLRDLIARQVRRHDENGIFALNRLSFTISQPSLEKSPQRQT